MNTIKENDLGYTNFKNLLKEEYPNPVYCYGEEDEGYANRYVKENPKASIHHGAFYKTAVCMDESSSLMLAYKESSFINNFIYFNNIVHFGKMLLDCELVLPVTEGGD